MLKTKGKFVKIATIFLSLSTIFFTVLGWSVGEFELFKAQNYAFYFQSWVSISGLVFSFIMAVTTFILYKKSNITSLKFISLAFLLTSFAYLITGYHASYCKVCSDLSMCSSSHNYSNYFIIIALVIAVLTSILVNFKNSVLLLKLFSYGIVLASFSMLAVLFFSISFMETPNLLFYEITQINLQGFVFIFPLILIALFYIYFKNTYAVTKTTSFIFALLFISFLPQAYHIFLCTECNLMECSEFYIFSALTMFIVIGLLIYSISLQLQEKK